MENELGVKRGTVRLVPHNPNWKTLFEEEKKLLLTTFSNTILKISHGGSTAIPTIPAKPIIDMFAVVRSLSEADAIKDDLEKLGYEYVGERGVPERRLAVKGPEEKRTHHLQFVEETSKEWTNHILIREYYLRHPDVAEEYARLKQDLAQKYPEDRGSYTNGKEEFIASVIQRAKREERQEKIPQIIKDVGFDFNWSEEKVWRIDVSVEEMSIKQLEWHFDIPFLWENGEVYNLTSREVIEKPNAHKAEYDRTMKADLSYPIDIMENKGRWLILDGLHRLMKASILGMQTVKVRKISRDYISDIVE